MEKPVKYTFEARIISGDLNEPRYSSMRVRAETMLEAVEYFTDQLEHFQDGFISSVEIMVG